MKKFNQSGAAHLAIPVIVVIVLVAAVGYMVYTKTKSSNNKTPTTPSPAQTQPSAISTKKSEETAAKTAASAHFKLVKDKQLTKAYDETCDEFKKNTTRSVFENAVNTQSIYTIDLASITLDNVQVKNNQARLSGEIGPLAPNQSLEVDLLKNNNSWCVLGYRIN